MDKVGLGLEQPRFKADFTVTGNYFDPEEFIMGLFKDNIRFK